MQLIANIWKYILTQTLISLLEKRNEKKNLDVHIIYLHVQHKSKPKYAVNVIAVLIMGGQMTVGYNILLAW